MKRIVVAVVSAIALAMCLCACSGSNDEAMDPVSLEIHDSYAGIYPAADGMAQLQMFGVITNNSEMQTAEIAELPQLTMDGEAIEATYEPIDMETADKLEPGKSVAYEVSYTFDASVDHEWGFASADGTVVDGLDEYAKIKEALRDYQGLPQVTEADIAAVEQEAAQRYQEFLQEQAAN